jgi:hypothetical protein
MYNVARDSQLIDEKDEHDKKRLQYVNSLCGQPRSSQCPPREGRQGTQLFVSRRAASPFPALQRPYMRLSALFLPRNQPATRIRLTRNAEIRILNGSSMQLTSMKEQQDASHLLRSCRFAKHGLFTARPIGCVAGKSRIGFCSRERCPPFPRQSQLEPSSISRRRFTASPRRTADRRRARAGGMDEDFSRVLGKKAGHQQAPVEACQKAARDKKPLNHKVTAMAPPLA